MVTQRETIANFRNTDDSSTVHDCVFHLDRRQPACVVILVLRRLYAPPLLPLFLKFTIVAGHNKLRIDLRPRDWYSLYKI